MNESSRNTPPFFSVIFFVDAQFVRLEEFHLAAPVDIQPLLFGGRVGRGVDADWIAFVDVGLHFVVIQVLLGGDCINLDCVEL